MVGFFVLHAYSHVLNSSRSPMLWPTLLKREWASKVAVKSGELVLLGGHRGNQRNEFGVRDCHLCRVHCALKRPMNRGLTSSSCFRWTFSNDKLSTSDWGVLSPVVGVPTISSNGAFRGKIFWGASPLLCNVTSAMLHAIFGLFRSHDGKGREWANRNRS